MGRYAIKTPPQNAKWEDMLAIWREADDIELFESAWNFDHFYPIHGDPNGPWKPGSPSAPWPRPRRGSASGPWSTGCTSATRPSPPTWRRRSTSSRVGVSTSVSAPGGRSRRRVRTGSTWGP